jgi:hypothetical protein
VDLRYAESLVPLWNSPAPRIARANVRTHDS